VVSGSAEAKPSETATAAVSAPTAMRDSQTLARSAAVAPEQVQVQEKRQVPPQAAGGSVGNIAGAATPIPTVSPALTVGGWRTVPRTEAAVRSGMPLYGVNGLEPVATAVSIDNRVVRTTYRLESGSFVELEQERTPSGPQSLALRSGDRAVNARAGNSAAAEASAASRTWSETRGNVRVSLRTVSDADLAALGARLRVE